MTYPHVQLLRNGSHHTKRKIANYVILTNTTTKYVNSKKSNTYLLVLILLLHYENNLIQKRFLCCFSIKERNVNIFSATKLAKKHITTELTQNLQLYIICEKPEIDRVIVGVQSELLLHIKPYTRPYSKE